jgi:hypothetical protein
MALAILCALMPVLQMAIFARANLLPETGNLAMKALGFLAVSLGSGTVVRRLRDRAIHRSLQGMRKEEPAARLRHLAVLDLISTVRRELSDPFDVLSAILAPIREETGATAAVLLMLNHDGVSLRVLATSGALAERLHGLKLPVDCSLAGAAITRAQPVALSADIPEELFTRAHEVLCGAVQTSVLCVPISSEGELLGVLELIDRQGLPAFIEDDLCFAVSAAGHAADAVKDAIAHERENRQVAGLTARYGAGGNRSAGGQREKILSRLLEGSMDVVGADAGCILLFDAERGELCPEVLRTVYQSCELPAISLSDGALGRVASERKPVVLCPARGSDPGSPGGSGRGA